MHTFMHAHTQIAEVTNVQQQQSSKNVMALHSRLDETFSRDLDGSQDFFTMSHWR